MHVTHFPSKQIDGLTYHSLIVWEGWMSLFKLWILKRESDHISGVKCIFFSFFFYNKKGKWRISTVANLTRRNYSNTCPLGAVHEGPKQWKLQALSQL
jgi:hypothetical protein